MTREIARALVGGRILAKIWPRSSVSEFRVLELSTNEQWIKLHDLTSRGGIAFWALLTDVSLIDQLIAVIPAGDQR